MISIKKFTASATIAALTITPLGPALATTEFNPNFLISDEEIQEASAMNRPDIQAFLDEKGGYISKLRIEDKDGKKRLVSDIIYRAGQEHNINPKYLLVKLQKEQSLVTDKSPTQKQLDGATGYGITDGCGWTCPTYFNNKGFGKQVDSAAGIIRWYYDNVATQGFIKRANKTYTISNQKVTPVNNATAFLYTYTPHIQGNKNFWILWQKWFDQVYPNGSLVKTANDDTVYLITDGKKRAFGSFAALTTRFDPKLIITVPASELSRYENGKEIDLPNYSILKNGSTYYLLDFDTLRKFKSRDTLNKLGFHPDEIITVTSADIAGFDIASDIITAESTATRGRVIFVPNTNTHYYIDGDSYNSISDRHIALSRFPSLAIEKGTLADLEGLTPKEQLLFRDGTIIGITGHNKIYVIEHGKKRHIASEAVFTGLGYSWDNIVWTDEITGTLHPTGQPIYLRRDVSTDQKNTTIADTIPTTITNEIHEDFIATPKEDTVYMGNPLSDTIDTYLIADYETEEILAGKNIDVERSMASLTKVLSAYGLMSQGLNLSGTVTYDSTKHKSEYHRFRIVDGEKIRNSDAMDAFLVSSLNTPAKMLVSEVEDNQSVFIKNVNTTLKKWGLEKTTIVDPSGVGVPNVTTAREYMTAFKRIAKNSEIKSYLAKKSYEYTELIDKDDKPKHFDVHSNDLVNENLPYRIIASKTGYLHEAGANLAMIIERKLDNKKFIIITMGNPYYTNRFDEPRNIAQSAIDMF